MPKNTLTSLTLDEISAVDNPAQVHAKMMIMKRDDAGALAEAIAKAEMDGARSFADVLSDNEERRRQFEAQEELWPLFGALQESLNSIAADEGMDRDAKLARIRASVDEFLTAVRDKWPDVEDELAKLFADPAAGGANAGRAGSNPGSEGDSTMPDTEKKVGELEAQVAELTKRAEDAEKASETLKAEKATAEAIAKLSEPERAHYDKLDNDGKAAFLKLSDDDRASAVKKAAEGDETVTVEGRTIRKSVVGADQFAIFKAQQARLEKQEEDLRKERTERELVELTKRAESEYASLPGEPIAKAKVLKAMAGMDEEDRKALDAMLKAGQAALDERMAERGTAAGSPTGSAEDDLDKMADRYAAENKVSKAAAYDAVLKTEEGSKLYSKSLNQRTAAH